MLASDATAHTNAGDALMMPRNALNLPKQLPLEHLKGDCAALLKQRPGFDHERCLVSGATKECSQVCFWVFAT